MIIFSSVRFLLKKSNQTEFFLKKTETELKPVSIQFGFLGQKPVQTGLAWFWIGLSRFFFSV